MIQNINNKINNTRKVSKETPLNELILRKYEMPYEIDTRELLKKFCLSLGLLQPGDSRDVIVDVIHALLIQLKEKNMLNSKEIENKVIQLRKESNLPLLGIASSNIRRQIKRLRDLHLVEKIKNEYRINEFSNLSLIFEEKIESFVLPSILNRIKEYFKKIDEKFT
ncbi:MAG: hypothetical protein ACLFPJ_01170 [Candidatus Woesearchaeota archaeon]